MESVERIQSVRKRALLLSHCASKAGNTESNYGYGVLFTWLSWLLGESEELSKAFNVSTDSIYQEFISGTNELVKGDDKEATIAEWYENQMKLYEMQEAIDSKQAESAREWYERNFGSLN